MPATRTRRRATTSGPASPAQFALIARLAVEKVMPADLYDSPMALHLEEAENGVLDRAEARLLIDALLALPNRQEFIRYASPAQRSFLSKLLVEREHDYPATDLETLVAAEASTMIDSLKAAPRRSVAELQAGMYRTTGGEIYKVQRAVHGSGKMCAKLLVVTVTDGKAKGRFVYQGLATRFVAAGDRMTLADAVEFGSIYGMCVRCGATLTDEESIARAMGPVCITKI